MTDDGEALDPPPAETFGRVLSAWTHHSGMECRTVEMSLPRRGVSKPAYYCGYVKTRFDASVPKADRPDAADLDDEVEVHGGITYGPDEEGWVGFDLCHAFDVCVDEDGEPLPGSMTVGTRVGMETQYTRGDVAEMVEEFADQLYARVGAEPEETATPAPTDADGDAGGPITDMDDWADLAEEPPEEITVGMRAGSGTGIILPGSIEEPCASCGHDVIISPATQEAIMEGVASETVVCMECVAGMDDDGEVQ